MSGNRTSAGSVLYPYFPTSDDSNFPDDVGDIGITTSPLANFDVADLDSGIGTTSTLRNAVVSRVKTDYCEFNIRIASMTSSNGTTNPTPSDSRWQVVGIGSDSSPDLFGIASDVDTGDAVAQDFARVFADSFGVEFGGSGGALNGSNSTLDRWANAIAGTVSHEAGHDYGLGHNASISQPTEDDRKNHLMASGSSGGLTGADRVKDRHFSDESFEILAANIGLYQQTVSNWDFINPNNTAADGFAITVLVDPSAGVPSAGSIYTGTLSPWNNVSISDDGSEMFQGTSYDRYRIDFTEPKGWANGDAGEVGAGIEFHVGVGLTTAYIVRETELRSGPTVLGLRPRVVGYTVDGSFDSENGDYHVTLSNADTDAAPLIVSDIEILHLPRTVAIDEMVAGGELLTPDGLPITPWAAWDPGVEVMEVADSANLSLGNLANPRAVDYEFEEDPGCERGIIKPPPIEDATGLGEVEYCPEGRVLGLFPSARVYVKATVTDPDATYFDANLGRFVTGPLSTRVFFQVPGKTPDLNENGVDDAIDIDNGTCEDRNGNGVCDHIEPQRFKYAAKLVCGIQPRGNDGRLVRGSYATTVNLLNPLAEEVRLSKTLSLSYPPEEQFPGDVLTIGKDLLRPDRALKVDCADIQRRLFPNGLPASYIEGFVVIESSGSLDVSAVYTSRDVAEAPDCGGRPESDEYCGCHGGHGNCGYGGCGPHRGGSQGCQPPDSISTTLDVEQIRERVIERKKPPVLQCPDLTVRDIGRPKVSCPAGAGTCETTVDYVIENIGNAASGPFESRATLDPRHSVTVTQPSDSGLAPGQSTSVTAVTPPGGNCYDPDCTVTVEADSSNRVDECREDNNSLVETTKG